MEEGSQAVAGNLAEAEAAGTSRIAYVECRAALARGRREARLTPRELQAAIRSLDERWPNLAAVELDDALARQAGRLVHEQALRSSDAIHLASALSFADGEPAAVRFACWDGRVWEAAARLGFRMTPESRPI